MQFCLLFLDHDSHKKPNNIDLLIRRTRKGSMQLLLIGSLMCSLFTSTLKPTEYVPAQKPKKIILLTSKGGYGHMAACATLKNILTDYDVSIVNPFEIISSLDIVKKISRGKSDGEQFYNSLLQNGWIRFMNFFCYRPAFYFIHRDRNKIETKIWHFLKQEKPDLLISTIPLLNYPISCAAEQSNIPFMLVTLDADLTKWLLDLEKLTHRNFMLTVGTRTPLVTQQLAAKKIPEHSIREIGCPLRKDFFEPKNKDAILRDWKLPSDKPIAMLIRGGTGSNKLIDYVTTLQKYDKPLHLLVCVGRNELLATRLNKLHKKDSLVTLSVIPFTTRISDLMFVSDILITQSTLNTCNEAMHFGIPILIDKTSPTLFWEDAAIDVINKNGTGAVFKKMQNLNELVEKYLGKKIAIDQTKKISSFDGAVQEIVSEMLSRSVTQKTQTIDLTT